MLMTILCDHYLSCKACWSAKRFTLVNLHAEKDILDGLHAVWTARRCPTSFLVGLRRHHSHPFCLMVGRLPQRLVLKGRESSGCIRKNFHPQCDVKGPLARR